MELFAPETYIFISYSHPDGERADLLHSYRRGPADGAGRHLNGKNGMFIRLLK